MKVEIDFRSVKPGQEKVFWAIRLAPETNDEMQALQRGIELKMVPKEYKMIALGSPLHYGIFFEEKDGTQNH